MVEVMYHDIEGAALRSFGGVTQAVFSLDNVSFSIRLKIKRNDLVLL